MYGTIVGFVVFNKTILAFHCNRYLTGGVDKRTLEKYEREAKEKNRESWYVYIVKGWDMSCMHKVVLNFESLSLIAW